MPLWRFIVAAGRFIRKHPDEGLRWAFTIWFVLTAGGMILLKVLGVIMPSPIDALGATATASFWVVMVGFLVCCMAVPVEEARRR